MIIGNRFVILLCNSEIRVNRRTTRIIYSRGRWKSWNINPRDFSGGWLQQRHFRSRERFPVIWLNYRCVPVYNYANRVSIPTGPAPRVCIPGMCVCVYVRVCGIGARNTSLCEYTGVCQADRPRSSFLPRPRHYTNMLENVACPQG